VPDPRKTVSTRLVIGPNASMSARQALAFFAGLCGICLGIAVVFAALGFWPVLPFAGAELVAVGVALAVVVRRNRYREVLWFDRDRVRVEFGVVGRGVRSHCEWPRSMTRVWLEHGPYPGSPAQLVLACGTQRRVIGGCLTDAEREALARRLKQLIDPAWSGDGTRSAGLGLGRT
jgi:uncharacterized membrane protein